MSATPWVIEAVDTPGMLLAQGMPSSEAATNDPRQAAKFPTGEAALDRVQKLPEARWPMWRVRRKAGAKRGE